MEVVSFYFSLSVSIWKLQSGFGLADKELRAETKSPGKNLGSYLVCIRKFIIKFSQKPLSNSPFLKVHLAKSYLLSRECYTQEFCRVKI